MSHRIKLCMAAAIAVSMLSPAAFAAGSKYQPKRIPGGPRPDQYMFVPVEGKARSDRPYALTGDTDRIGKHRRTVRYVYVPTHPKGTHSN
jgi:hypothetical protein